MSHRSLLTASLLCAGMASLSLVQCGGDDGNDDGTGGKGGGLNLGGNGGAGGLDLDGSAANGGGGGAISPDAACGTSSEEATLVPVNMLVMFDRSGSMNQNNKWPQASNALIAFFQDPATAGLRIALRFFPHDQPAAGCTNQGCNTNACSQLLVPIGAVTKDPAPADTQEAALVSGVQSSAPGNGGGTPMFAALGGAEQWAMAHAAAHPNEKVVVVLVTDGLPNGCDEDINNIAALASAARTSHGVLTYAVGLEGSAENQMDTIAVAGGTNKGIFIGSSANAQAELLAALKAIQGSQVSCEFQMPAPKDGSTLDPKKVNVNYTPGGGSTQTLGQVGGAADCANGGWYYDNPTSPSKITLCPSTCSTVQADKAAKMEILLGCATQLQPPPS